ncbi:TonB-dependent receptor domain-containing protein [Arenicella xantha]|uniref:Vitamin B12 transporter n=1 Tax=Arenicella xantha TaxID=644221 RepID=A0A395JLG9_9GAMM|nr:TonB-dependent receptor [Arenicella xantha]RBP48587.1 vitamin B12 transporter [Arenicella xantha]
MIFPLKSSLALCCLAVSPLAFSQGSNDPAIEQVLVTAKGQQTLDNALHTAHIFTLDDIEAAQVSDIPALLSKIAGISISDSGGRGSATSVFVRGVSGSQTIVLIDGVRVGSATLGAAALNSYPIEAIERIEILKGPFSGLYGADAVGGVIQLFTKKGGDGRGAVSATIGSNSLSEVDFALSGAGSNYSFHIAGHSEDTDGIDRTSILTEGNDDEDGFAEDAISIGGQLQLGDSSTIDLSILGTDNLVEFDNTFGADPGLQTENSTLSTALAFNTQLNDTLKWATTLGLNEDEAITNGAFPSEFKTDRNSLGSEFTWAASASTMLTFGADYYDESITSSNDFPITERDNIGAFAQVQSLGERFGTVVSLRYDDNSAYGTNTNGSIAVNLNVSDDIRLIASYGTAFVAPSFNYLYFPFFGNPDLLPEESESVELSIAGNHGAVDWRVSAYQTDIENLFSFNPVTFLAANVGQAEIKGVEAEIRTSVANWDVSIQADALSAEDVDSGIELDDRPQRSASLTAAKEIGPLNLQFDVRSESRRFDNRGTQISGYALLDISAVYQISESTRISAKIDNLFDKEYTLNLIGSSNRYNTEGRHAKLTLRYSF